MHPSPTLPAAFEVDPALDLLPAPPKAPNIAPPAPRAPPTAAAPPASTGALPPPPACATAGTSARTSAGPVKPAAPIMTTEIISDTTFSPPTRLSQNTTQYNKALIGVKMIDAIISEIRLESPDFPIAEKDRAANSGARPPEIGRSRVRIA